MNAPRQSLPSKQVPAPTKTSRGHPELPVSNFQARRARSSSKESTLTSSHEEWVVPKQETLYYITNHDCETHILVPVGRQTDGVGKATQTNKPPSNEGAEPKAHNIVTGSGETTNSDVKAASCLSNSRSPRRILRRKKARIFSPSGKETDKARSVLISTREPQSHQSPTGSHENTDLELKVNKGLFNIESPPRILRRKAARFFKPLHETEGLSDFQKTKHSHSNGEQRSKIDSCGNKNSKIEVIQRLISLESHSRCLRHKKAQFFLPLSKIKNRVGKFITPKAAHSNEGAELKGQRSEMCLRRTTSSERKLIRSLFNFEIPHRFVHPRAPL